MRCSPGNKSRGHERQTKMGNNSATEMLTEDEEYGRHFCWNELTEDEKP